MEATGRRHIFITGTRGIGKSTLFRQLRSRLDAPQLLTEACPEEGVYLHWQGQSVPIGVYDPALGGKENKMRPVEEGFLTGAQILQTLGQSAAPWVAIDEIGYLETVPYQKALMTLLEQKRVLAVVRKQDLPFLNSLLARQDALVVDPDGGNTGCVIMASGLGKRFGGNKLMESLRGKPMIAWALEAAEGVFQKIVVVTRHESVKAWCDAQGIQTVLHDLPYRSDTVRLGLQALGDVDSCLFLPGDQPFVTKDSLYAMALAAKAHDAIWQLGGAAPVLFPKWTFPELLTLPEGKGGGVLVKKYETFVKSLPPALPWELQDVDTKEDLAQLASGMCCQV